MEIKRTGERIEARFNLQGDDRRTAKRLFEINEPWRKAQTEIGESMSAELPTATFVDRNGMESVLPTHDPAALERKERLTGMRQRRRPRWSERRTYLPDGTVLVERR